MNKDYSIIREVSKEVHDCIQSGRIYEYEDGRHFLDETTCVNIEQYYTKGREECKYESHHKYIDVQFVMEGEENIEILSVTSLDKKTNYNCDKDILFFKNKYKGKTYHLNKGDFLIIYPGQAHMPCLSIAGCEHVRKAVFKVPVSNLKKLFFMDVDGTLTDGKIHISQSGEMFKSFDVKDGYGISRILPTCNWVPVIITGRKSEIVEKRAIELGIGEIYQSCNDKQEKMKEVAEKYHRYIDENGKIAGTAFLGDDIPDRQCLEMAEYSGCPVDAVKNIKNICAFVSKYKGGAGAAREFIDYLIEKDVQK